MGCTDSNDTLYILQTYCGKGIVSPASLAQQPTTTTDSVEDTVYCLDPGYAVLYMTGVKVKLYKGKIGEE